MCYTITLMRLTHIIALSSILLITGCTHTLPVNQPVSQDNDEMPIQKSNTPLRLIAKRLSETQNTEPRYRIELTYPVFPAKPSPSQQRFNTLMNATMNGMVTTFKAMPSTEKNPDPETLPSTLTGEYRIVFQNEKFVSITQEFTQYTAGAAHPISWYLTVNYDLKNGRLLTLADVFNAGMPYLDRLSQMTRMELSKRNQEKDPFSNEWMTTGTIPAEGNFSQFTISPTTYTVYFGEYQVAPYAAGMPQVAIPLIDLKNNMQPEILDLFN